MRDFIDVVFDGPPGQEPGKFVEVENSNGASIRAGEWTERDDGNWVLRIPIGADNANIIREVQKALDVLRKVEAMMEAEATMNATKHLADVVRPVPLAGAVSSKIEDLRLLVVRLQEGEL